MRFIWLTLGWQLMLHSQVGPTALQMARRHHFIECVNLLLMYDAEDDEEGEDGSSSDAEME